MTTRFQPALVHELLDAQATCRPQQPALQQNGRTWTYRQLWQRSHDLANWLLQQRVKRADRVLIVAGNHADTVALLYAASRIGAVFVIVNDQISRYQFEHIVADCRPAVVLATECSAHRVASASNVPVRLLSELPATSPDEQGDRPPSGVTVPAGAPCLSIDPVALIYTSGSTAMPKAVVSPHRQVLFATRAIQSRLAYLPDDTVFSCLPLSFDYGLYQVFLCCLVGARLVLGNADDAGAALLGRLSDEHTTVFPLVPHLATTLVRLAGRSGKIPEQLRMVTNTGAALSVTTSSRLRELIPALDVVPMFGLTECKRVSIEEPNADQIRPGSLGLPLPDTEVFVIDVEGNRLQPGEIGELIVRGPHVMAGYWHAPELTAGRFRVDEFGHPLLHTGDRCWLDEQGRLYFAGRDDDIFKQRGFRVSAIEIEAAALDVPGVELAAVLKPEHNSPTRLVVTGSTSAETLAKELAARLEETKLPAEYHIVRRFPLNINGKIDKAALRRALQSGPAPAGPTTAGEPNAASGAQPYVVHPSAQR
jgi:acyl-CoA synthetase (AMP-forming)/AMP-acid ligase II